jgi:hypothetical protein
MPDDTGFLCSDLEGLAEEQYEQSMIELARAVKAAYGDRRRLSPEEKGLLQAAHAEIKKSRKDVK